MNVSQAMPHSEEHEKAVLAIILGEPHRIDEESTLTPEHFHLPHHRKFYELIRAKHGRGEVLDIALIVPDLQSTGSLDGFGGIGGLLDLAGYQVHRQSFGLARHRLNDMLARRLAVIAAHRLEEAAFDVMAADDYLQAAGEPITAIHDAVTAAKVAPDAKALGNEFISNFEQLMRGYKKPMGIETGIEQIDHVLRGLHPGMMGVISARSSGGKSTLATQIMCGIGSPEFPVIYLPLEGTTQAAYSRCVIQLSKLAAMAVTAPLEYAQLEGRQSLTKHELMAVQKAVMTVSDGGFHFDPPANRKLQTILSSIRRAHRTHKIKVAFVDYIQLIRGERGHSKEEEVASISHGIQELAAELGITIIVMSQENENGETKHARAIEEDCDWWLSIIQHRDRAKENFQQHRHVLVSKDRHNSNGGKRLPLQLDRNKVRFVFAEEPKEEPKKGRANF